ncbi:MULTISPECIES: acyl carrier protein [unclassified Streptomyces]|uniref:acyl carrier protein n=1 Tax=unclassified Streptomyces TaxID=2593676 RepID=UPI0013703092|nr:MULTISPECIES: acyl carrier protein [unclassified Streptomyces]MCW5253537.1 acyl carrier protein [Streptomyces sp. SHP 1-2]MYU24058.1 polyketide synthase [Streptomyces sp. SID8352]
MSATDLHTELREWIAHRVASYLERAPEEIDPGIPLSDYGLGSVYAFVLCGDLEDHLGFPIDPTVVWDHQSVEELSAHLAGVAAEHRADPPRATP